MPYRALLLGLFLALPARAGDPPSEAPIDDSVTDPLLKEFEARYEPVRKGTLKGDDFVQYYRGRAQEKGTPREQALHAFLYAFTLRNVVPQTRLSKETRLEFERAISLAPVLRAMVELAGMAEESGNRDEADRILRRALALKPNYVRAKVALGFMAMHSGDPARAKTIFKSCFDTPPLDVQALGGLITANLALFAKSFDEKEKEQLAKEAIAQADALTTLDPESPNYKLFKAQVYLQLGRVKEAIDYLEGLVGDGSMKPVARVEVLKMLRKVYQAGGKVDGVKRTLERLLKSDALRPEDRQHIAANLKDLDAMGQAAFVKWQVDSLIEVLHNEGRSVEDRQRAQRALLEFVETNALGSAELRPMLDEVFRELFKVLVTAPPEMQAVELAWLRKGRWPPRLLAVLVHFLHPEGKTEEVREEALRTVASCGGIAAIPAIYYSLGDASGRVVREANSQLSTLCETRSALASRQEPFTLEQCREARRMWATYFHSEDGAEQLTKAFRELSESVVRVEPDTLTSAPMIDHAASVIRDADVPWVAWAAAYDFLVRYWGKDFRPVARRGQPVEESERESIVTAFEEEYTRIETPQPAALPPKGQEKAGMAKGK